MKTRFVLLFCAAAVAASAATSTTWEVSGFAEFLKGRFSGLSLTADGLLQLGPSTRFTSPLDQPATWSIAVAPDGSVYAGTGHRGKLFRISPDGHASNVWTANQPEIFAVCVDRTGVVYAGTSPNGGVYRIENGHAEEIWHSTAKYIWALQCAADGTLYAGGGEPANVYRFRPGSAAELFYATGQTNVTALTLGSNGHVFAGTDPNGLLYEISSAKHGTVLLDSNLPEIRAIAVDPSGIVYAAAMGGSLTTRLPGATAAGTTYSTGAVIATAPTVVTVTESAGNAKASDEQQGTVKAAPDQAKPPAPPAVTTPPSTAPAVIEVPGAEKSAIYRINIDRSVETLRSSKEDNVYDLLLDDGAVIFSTDVHGRIYRLQGTRTSVLSELGQGEATRILKSGSTLFVALSTPARLVALGPARSEAGFYESQVHDSASVAKWGHLQWHGTGSGIVFRTRTGNAARVDATWSPWSAPISDPANALIESPVGRFIQWRAEWAAGSAAQVDAVDIPYLPQNSPPVIHSITVTSITGTNAAKSAATASSSSSAYTITVTDTGEPPAASSSTTSSQSVSRLQSTQTQVSWQADDPDGDKLVYSVYFRAEDERNWQLLRSHMFENTLLLDPDVFADGRYFFRIVASDAPSNPPEYSRQTELVSTPVLIDNTPPVVTLGSPRRNGASLDIDIDAKDRTSPLRLCEYSLDAGLWQPIEAVDGITDSPHEQFHLHLDNLRPGEHLLVFRVYDSANNAGLAKVILK